MSRHTTTKRVASAVAHETPWTPWTACAPLPSTPSPSFSEVSLPSTDGPATPPQLVLNEISSPSSKPSPGPHGSPRSSLIAMNPVLPRLHFDLRCDPDVTASHHRLEPVTDPGVPRLIVVDKERFYGWKCVVDAGKGSHVVTAHDVHRAMYRHAQTAMTAAELRFHPTIQRQGPDGPRRVDSLYGRTRMRVISVKAGDDGLEIRVEFI